MKNLKGLLLAIGCVAMMAVSSGKVQAQGRGNFDPAQFKQMVIDRYKEQMAVTNDDEWQVISTAIGKVFDAGMEARAARFGGFGGGRNRGGNNNGGNADDNNRRRRFGPQPSAEQEDLQKALDAKAPIEEVKAKLAKLREANVAKEAALTTAQEDLRKLLTARQEAIAVVGGLLK